MTWQFVVLVLGLFWAVAAVLIAMSYASTFQPKAD